MKFFIVVLSLAVICSVSADYDEDIEIGRKLMQDCAGDLAITHEELQKYHADIKSSEDEPKAQNLAKCFFQKIDFIDQNGDFQESHVIEIMATGENSVQIEEILKQCTVMAGDTKANAFALKLYACYKEAFTGF